MIFAVRSMDAQITGQGAISGTVLDPDGASVPRAKVDVTNTSTNVVISRNSTSSGYYVVSPLPPGKYTVTVTVEGFSQLVQENVSVDALQTTTFNPKLALGKVSDTVTVTTAPPALQTANAVLGGTIENDVYSELPVTMTSSNPRDPTAFASLLPGTTPGGRSGTFDGTGAGNTNELYMEGVPLTTVDSQGDSRKLENLSIESVDQTQIQTSGSSAQFQGMGVENFSIKQGTNQFHGNAYIFFKNTILDSWGFFQKSALQPNAQGQMVPSPKTPENQNEISVSLGGPVLKNKLFFFGNYDRYHYRSVTNPTLQTIPTMRMRQGDFSEMGAAGYHIYDPTTQTACTAANNGVACATPFSYNGVADVIDPSKISPIAKAWAANLPAVTSSGITNNYLSGRKVGNDNWAYTGRVDYTISDRQQLAFISNGGTHLFSPYDYGATSVLPYPYTNGTDVNEKTSNDIVKHTYTFTPHVVNQARMGYARFWTTVGNKTLGDPTFTATALGIGNLPQGLAGNTTPAASFSGGINTPEAFAAPTQYHEAVNTYTLADDLTWSKGHHNFTFGGNFQFLQFNQSAADSPSKPMNFAFTNTSTGGFDTDGNIDTASGASYASFLLGAVGSTSVYIQDFSTLGARYKAFSPYVQDDWKVTQNLTLNLGLRWDLYTPFREVNNRWSFFNPNVRNPATGNMGALSYIGNGAGTCNCTSPVNTWYKNFGPRVGFAWQVTSRDVVRGSFSIMYSHNGGVGGSNGGNYNGTGQVGLTVSTAFASSTQGEQPAFYLNPSLAAPYANSGLPAYNSVINRTSTANTGNYVGGPTASSLAYADPYLSGRAPYTESYNFGIQHLLAKDTTISLDWVANQSHFLYAQSRGVWENQLAPQYQVLGSLLKQLPSGVDTKTGQTYLAEAQAKLPGIGLPYGNFGGAQGTIGQMLKPFPQYSALTDTWGDIGNANYNALQITLKNKNWHGLNYTLNYTFSKTIDDIAGVRSGYAIPNNVIDGGGGTTQANRIDRSVSAGNIPNLLHIFGTYTIPYGTMGHAGYQNHLTRALFGGWNLSYIFSKTSGAPLSIAGVGCLTPGSCYPSYQPGYTGNVRINGGFSSVHTVSQVKSTVFLDKNAFAGNPTTQGGKPQIGTPGNYGYNFGNAPRTAPYGLYNIGTYNLDAGIKRTFPIYRELKFSIQGDCFNVTNHVQFGGLGTSLASPTAFGLFSKQSNSARDWQLAAKFNF
ncbi:MAG: TonB-dependent receptor [Acidobacteriaceae bacterium]|nr:TonB-dependent receptor [Acidobacteriaceae bacterium]